MARSPRSRALDWLASGWFDREFYAALRGRRFGDDVEAAEDFVEHGMQLLLSPHPRLHVVDRPPPTRGAWRRGRVGRVLADLGAEVAAGRLDPAPGVPSARDRFLDVAHRLGREGEAGPSDVPVVDWTAVAGRARRPDLTSVVVVADDMRDTIRSVRGVLDAADGRDLQVLIVDCGAPVHETLGAYAALQDRAEVDLVRLPAGVEASTGANVGISRSVGEVVVLLDAHVVLRRGAIGSMLAVLEDPVVACVQPLLLGADDRILSAGLVTADDGEPEPVLVGHPPDDARRLEGHPLAAIAADAVALRVRDAAGVGGLREDLARSDAVLDLANRLGAGRPGGLRLAPTARATVTGRVSAPTSPTHPAGRVRDPVVVRRPADTPVQRWSIKLPSSPGPAGDRWGDTHFAEALADALRDLGQDVVTYRRGAHESGPIWLDDVSLALRGLHPVPPVPGHLNVLWVISHPDDVDPAELDGYDHVFAASVPWSAALSASTGRTVHPLLQASEFEPPGGDSLGAQGSGDAGVVFVGNAGGGRSRPLVHLAVEAGVPLVVYGTGWEDLPEGAWRGAYVDNARLPDLYRRHGIVLADHWPDMARTGFIANRVFDAVASGARVVCDDVAGIHDVFDPRDVAVVHDADDLRRVVSEFRRTARAQDVPRPPLSFRDRARTLLAEVSGG
ncbi:glycosyltransferase family protein [Nocardioides sp. T2.26MG-1]|uniref:glycosyltransferase family protein n=1 Tax=Nocardioides sp. T2.26MG-1 TaxID=3041166 RepID=UPI002541813E|nr:glycosyltransferase [Nocardioides sp. T2.26MG-1]